MKTFNFCVLFIWAISGFSQDGLDGVSVELDLTGPEKYVKEIIAITATEATKKIELRALVLIGSEIKVEDVFLDGKSISFEESEVNGIRKLFITPGPQLTDLTLEVTYLVRVEEDKFYIPVFFTDYAATSSENDFFNLNIVSPLNKGYALHFPKVPVQIVKGPKNSNTSLQLPALPSMLRLELMDKNEQWSFFKMVDVMVAIVFVGIGFLIWRFRKYLNYG